MMLILQYPLSDSFDEEDDDELKREIEALADRALRAGGLGSCDGGDMDVDWRRRGTPGKINVFCSVQDGPRACGALVAALEEEGIEGHLIALFDETHPDAGFRVLWPEDFRGTFNPV